MKKVGSPMKKVGEPIKMVGAPMKMVSEPRYAEAHYFNKPLEFSKPRNFHTLVWRKRYFDRRKLYFLILIYFKVF